MEKNINKIKGKLPKIICILILLAYILILIIPMAVSSSVWHNRKQYRPESFDEIKFDGAISFDLLDFDPRSFRAKIQLMVNPIRFFENSTLACSSVEVELGDETIDWIYFEEDDRDIKNNYTVTVPPQKRHIRKYPQDTYYIPFTFEFDGLDPSVSTNNTAVDIKSKTPAYDLWNARFNTKNENYKALKISLKISRNPWLSFYVFLPLFLGHIGLLIYAFFPKHSEELKHFLTIIVFLLPLTFQFLYSPPPVFFTLFHMLFIMSVTNLCVLTFLDPFLGERKARISLLWWITVVLIHVSSDFFFRPYSTAYVYGNRIEQFKEFISLSETPVFLLVLAGLYSVVFFFSLLDEDERIKQEGLLKYSNKKED